MGGAWSHRSDRSRDALQNRLQREPPKHVLIGEQGARITFVAVDDASVSRVHGKEVARLV